MANDAQSIGGFYVYMGGDAKELLEAQKSVQKSVTDTAAVIDREVKAAMARIGNQDKALLSASEATAKWRKDVAEAMKITSKDTAAIEARAAAVKHNQKVEDDYAAAMRKYRQDMVVYRNAIAAAAEEKRRLAAAPPPSAFAQAIAGIKQELGEVSLRGWNVRSMMQGLMAGIGVGSSMQVISMIVGAVSKSFKEVADNAKLANENAKALNKTFSDLHSTMNRYGTYGKPKAMLPIVEDELAKARREWKALNDEQTKVMEDRKKLETGLYGNSSRSQLAEKYAPDEANDPYRINSSPLGIIGITDVSIDTGMHKKSKEIFDEIAAVSKKILDLETERKNINGQIADEVNRERNALAGSGGGSTGKSMKSLSEEDKARAIQIEKDLKEANIQMGEALKDQLDPWRAVNREIERNNKLVEDGAITTDEADAANEKLLRSIEEITLARQQQNDQMQMAALDQFEASAKLRPMDTGDNAQLLELQREKETLKRHYESLGKIKVDYTKAYNDKVAELDRRSMAITQASHRMIAMSMLNTFQSMVERIGSMMAEGSRAAKVFFAISKAMSIAQAIISAHEGAAKARALFPGPVGMALGTTMLVLGYTDAALMAAQTVASFEGGGMTPSGARMGGMDGRGGMLAMLHPDEKVVDLTRGQKSDEGGVSIIVNNYSDSKVEVDSSADGKTITMIVKQVSKQIANDIENGGGPVSLSMERNYRLQRGYRQ